MDAKIGNNSFPQRDLNIREKSSGKSTVDPLKMKSNFGDKDLSQILNSVADPNYKAQKTRVKGHGNAELGKDAFFKLMLTQMKQQDPTNPLKSHEMAAQLAQFSSVEQLANMNETLTKMSAKGNTDNKFEILSMIGKVVSGDSSQIDRVKGDKSHNIQFMLPKAADSVTVKIKDNKGILVKKYDLKDLKEGKNQIVWNGMTDEDKDARVGQYTATIEASSKGRRMKADTKFSGPVDAVQFGAKGPVLMVSGQKVNLKDVKKIAVNKVETADAAKNVVNPNSKMSKGAVEEKKILNNLDAAKMDKGLREKLEGTVKKPKLAKLMK
ncbi:MAG: hypothetical protein HRT44_02670 [Bdellovibrionales bacterium]|nr:hypothetical protein [Bdellovibrionales bacterium]NQZ18150.1 hypothetical protein [Bdellovibrionales bacterium]